MPPGRAAALVVELTPGDAPAARWEVEVTVRSHGQGWDFGGHPREVERAAQPGTRLVARLGLTEP